MRQFLAYIFGSRFIYKVAFEKSEVENHKEFCEKQNFNIYLNNIDGTPLITLERAILYENETSP